MKEKKKKSIFKKWWFWVIVVVVIGVAGSNGEEAPEAVNDNKTQAETETADNSTPVADVDTEGSEDSTVADQHRVEEKAPEKEVVDVPTEYKSALKKAKTYSDAMNMSKAGLYDQLISEYGEKFTEEEALYTVDNVEADWKENALKKAKTYQETMAMSPSAVYDQLISEYGEKFTPEEAKYAIDNLE